VVVIATCARSRRTLTRHSAGSPLSHAVTPAAPAHPLEVDFDAAIHNPPELVWRNLSGMKCETVATRFDACIDTVPTSRGSRIGHHQSRFDRTFWASRCRLSCGNVRRHRKQVMEVTRLFLSLKSLILRRSMITKEGDPR